MRASVVPIVLLASVSSGCSTSQSVRYVYQDGTFGVIGMPENTNKWPTRYQTRAEKLMARHFPEGYEIVRAEEVAEGSRTIRTEGSSVAEIGPQIPAEVLRFAMLGHTSSRSQADTVTIKECRMIYRRADHPSQEHFSSDVECSPRRYLDPNEAERKKSEIAALDAGKAKAEKPKEELAAKKPAAPAPS